MGMLVLRAQAIRCRGDDCRHDQLAVHHLERVDALWHAREHREITEYIAHIAFILARDLCGTYLTHTATRLPKIFWLLKECSVQHTRAEPALS